MNNNNHQPTVLIIDSGIGGLSVAKEIRLKCGNSRLLYLADKAGFPYGAKSEAWVCKRVSQLIRSMSSQYKLDLVVIACNTASTIALETLRSEFTLPFVGVVPAVKPAAALTKTKSIAVLATQATVQRRYTHLLIQDFASDLNVQLIPSAKLADWAEEKIEGARPSVNEIREHLRIQFDAAIGGTISNIDTIVLACTHFPLLLEELKLALPNISFWVDSGEAIANRVHSLLDQADLLNIQDHATSNKHLFFNTEQDEQCHYKKAQIQNRLGNFEFGLFEN